MGVLVDNKYFYTRRFLLRWRLWAIISFPIILLPVMIIPHFIPEAKCAYVMLLVMLYWIFNVIPLGITAVLPVALLPMLGILPSNIVSPLYMKDINMLMAAVMMCAAAVEYSNLHRRIALKILLLLGTKPRWLFLGFLLTTLTLSMWINNTSATSMMSPIADSVLLELYPFDPKESEKEREDKQPPDRSVLKEASKIRNGLLLCICGGANIGGTGTMMGTGTNLVLINTLEVYYPDGEVVMNYVLWMAFCMPNLIICGLLMWLVFQIQFMGFKGTFNRKAVTTTGDNTAQRMQLMIREKYNEMGPLSYHEATVLVIFIILVILWILREPGFMDGWLVWIHNTVKIKDSAAAILAVILMFALPTLPDQWWLNIKDPQLDPPPPRCLTWEIVHARFTWSVLFILGGGFALAEACKISGLSAVIASWLLVLEGTSPILLCFLVMVATVCLTSVTSNTAASVILLPIMVELANAMKIAPMFLLLPTTLSCSFSFLLPISTPPNAIVFERSSMSIPVMAKTGFWLAVVCMLTTAVMMTFYAPLIFDFDIHTHPHHEK